MGGGIKSNQIKSNHFYCHITTAQVPWWVKFLWACSRQCRKTTDNLPMDRQCKKTINNLHMDRQCKKTALEHLQCSRQCKKKNTTTAIYIWTDSAKKQHQFTYGQYIFTDYYYVDMQQMWKMRIYYNSVQECFVYGKQSWPEHPFILDLRLFLHQLNIPRRQTYLQSACADITTL